MFKLKFIVWVGLAVLIGYLLFEGKVNNDLWILLSLIFIWPILIKLTVIAKSYALLLQYEKEANKKTKVINLFE